MLPTRVRDWPPALLWLALLAPATLIGGYALRYLNFDPRALPYELRVNMLHASPSCCIRPSAAWRCCSVPGSS